VAGGGVAHLGGGVSPVCLPVSFPGGGVTLRRPLVVCSRRLVPIAKVIQLRTVHGDHVNPIKSGSEPFAGPVPEGYL
jgi:hypothetical protein